MLWRHVDTKGNKKQIPSSPSSSSPHLQCQRTAWRASLSLMRSACPTSRSWARPLSREKRTRARTGSASTSSPSSWTPCTRYGGSTRSSVERRDLGLDVLFLYTLLWPQARFPRQSLLQQWMNVVLTLQLGRSSIPVYTHVSSPVLNIYIIKNWQLSTESKINYRL